MKPTVKPNVRTAGRTVAAGLLLPLVLTACGSGRDPLTYGNRDQGDSSQAVADGLTVLNLRVLPAKDGAALAKGGDARVALTLVNEASKPDALVGVTTTAAASVALVKDTAPVDEVPVPARGTAAPGYSLVLRGLTRPLRSGEFVTLKLTFATARATEVLVPVATDTAVLPRASANPEVNEPAHSGGGEGHEKVESVIDGGESGKSGEAAH